MNQKDFLQELAAQGFPAPVVVDQIPNGGIGPHRHQFEAKALILEGEITLEVDGVRTLYRQGDVFHLLHEQLHAEQYGPQGVKYLAGRKV